jgi:hypothetical protein
MIALASETRNTADFATFFEAENSISSAFTAGWQVCRESFGFLSEGERRRDVNHVPLVISR